METKFGIAQQLYERRNQLVKSQIQKIADLAMAGAVILPVTDETVRAHVDSNFSFYFGTLTRRRHSVSHSLSGPLSLDVLQQEYTSAVAHIGHVVNRYIRPFGADVVDMSQVSDAPANEIYEQIAA